MHPYRQQYHQLPVLHFKPQKIMFEQPSESSRPHHTWQPPMPQPSQPEVVHQPTYKLVQQNLYQPVQKQEQQPVYPSMQKPASYDTKTKAGNDSRDNSRPDYWNSPRGLKIMQIAEDSMFQSRMLEVLRTYPCRLQESPAEILPHLFLGNYMDARNTRRLRDLGITHVLNCASLHPEVVNPYPEESGVVGFLSFTADDADDYDMSQHFEDAKNFIDDAVASGGKVLVHCAQGINRSGFIVVAYLMASQKWDLIESTEYVKTHRGLLLTNKSFQKQLIQFARENELLHPQTNPQSEFSIPL